ncbi:MAG: hypothetical protein ACK5M7_21485 [Draconibacterium sp.]
MEQSFFPIYKGLQKPLVFKGFKGRYIYWAVSFIVSGIVLTALIGTIFNVLTGVFVFAIITGGGIFYTSQKQKNGLYDKTRNNAIYVFKVNLRGIRNVKKENI